MKIILNQLKLI